MKLKFKNQDFQNDAVETVAKLFKGQEKANTTFSVSDNSAQYNLLENEFGLGNQNITRKLKRRAEGSCVASNRN